jgi:serine/threonine protein kinase
MVIATRNEGRYALEERIGGNGLSDVYRARDNKEKGLVCLKEWSAQSGRKQGNDAPQSVISDGIEKEANLYEMGSNINVGLDHPNIQKAYEYFEEEVDGAKRQCLVSEYVSGNNLKELLSKGWEPSEGEVLECARSVLSAMQHYNERGVVHRDIKPSNIMSSEDGIYKVIDFSVATNQRRGEDRSTVISTTNNHSYQSLEIAQLWSEAEIRDDLYSLGIVLAEMVNGEFPEIIEGEVSFKKSSNENLNNLIGGLTGLFRSQRYNSPKEALDSLEGKVGEKKELVIPEGYKVSTPRVLYHLGKKVFGGAVKAIPNTLVEYLPVSLRPKRYDENDSLPAFNAIVVGPLITASVTYSLSGSVSASGAIAGVELMLGVFRLISANESKDPINIVGHPVLTFPHYMFDIMKELGNFAIGSVQENFKKSKLELIKKQLPKPED